MNGVKDELPDEWRGLADIPETNYFRIGLVLFMFT